MAINRMQNRDKHTLITRTEDPKKIEEPQKKTDKKRKIEDQEKEDRSPCTLKQTDIPTQQSFQRPNAVIAAGKLILAQKPPLRKRANRKLSQAQQSNKINTYFKVGTGSSRSSAKGLVDLTNKSDPGTETRQGPTPKGQEEMRPDRQL